MASSLRDASLAEVYRAIARVQPVNGSVTHMLRQRLLRRDKDRTRQTHHAEDACLLLLAGPAVVQAFNTEAAQTGAAPADERPADFLPVGDAHHQQRLRRAAGRVPLATLDSALADIVEPDSETVDLVTGRSTWRLTAAGKGLRRRVDEMTAKCAIRSRPRTPSETGTPGALHNATHYGRREITVDGRSETVVTQRMNARGLIALLDKGKLVADSRLAAAAPDDTILREICAEIEGRHDSIVHPDGGHRHRWISVRLAAVVPAHAAAVMADIAALEALDTVPDAERTPDQQTRREALRRSALLVRAVAGKTPENRARAREQEILTRALLDAHWGPRGLRHLIMAEKKPPALVRIRTNKTDALGRPAPGAAAWVKTDGNAVSQLWRVDSVLTADGRRIRLSKPIEKRLEISNLEYARLNGLDDAIGAEGPNAPPQRLRQDINRLTPLWRQHGAQPGGYLGTVVGPLEEKVRAALRAAGLRKTLTEAGITPERGWFLDKAGTHCKEEIAKGDVIRKDGRLYRVEQFSEGYVYGMPVVVAGAAPRETDEAQALAAEFGVKVRAKKGVKLF